MIGVIILGHGSLPHSFLEVLEHIMGPQHHVKAFTVNPTDEVLHKRDDLLGLVRSLNTGDGVIILTDTFGGTPSNLALSLIDLEQVEILAGINLPMLIKIASLLDKKPLKEVIELGAEAGKKYMTIASEVLSLTKTGTQD